MRSPNGSGVAKGGQRGCCPPRPRYATAKLASTPPPPPHHNSHIWLVYSTYLTDVVIYCPYPVYIFVLEILFAVSFHPNTLKRPQSEKLDEHKDML